MLDILFNTLTYILIIGLGYFLKRIHMFGKDAGDVLAKIVVNLTLPAMLLSASNRLIMDSSMLVYIILGIMCNVIMLVVSYVLTRNNTPLIRGVSAMSCAGIDVGNFVLPFVLEFFPGQGIMMINSFNIGNTIMNNGLDFVFASKVAAGKQKFNIKDMVRRLFSSVTFDTYILIIVMSCLGWVLPHRVIQFVDVIGSANIFIVMLMIGLKLQFGTKDSVGEEKVAFNRIFIARFAGAACMSAVTWMLPIPTLGKIIAAMAYFGPPTTASNAYAHQLGYRGDMTAKMNVFSIFPVILILTAIIMAARSLGLA